MCVRYCRAPLLAYATTVRFDRKGVATRRPTAAIVSSTAPGIRAAIVTNLGYSNRLGAASRLEFLLVPLAYGIGGPVGIVVSANLGAHKVERAVRASWVGVLMACGLTEAIGLAAAAYRRS
jgi:hypothetical protein